MITIQEKEKYGNYEPWEIRYTPMSIIYPQSSSNSVVDFSLATRYEMTIIDPSGSKTIFYNIFVIPGDISSTLVSNTDSTLIKNFCSQNPLPSMCDGIFPLTATTLEKQRENLVAGTNEFYRFTFKPRDQYGNRINMGSVKISYQTKTASVRFLSGDASNYSAFIGAFA